MPAITIPGETVTILRSALQSELGGPAARLEEASLAEGKEKRPELFSAALAELNALCVMLDVIGWCEPDDPAAQPPVALDLDLFRRLAVNAMSTKLMSERDFLTERDASGEHDRIYEMARRDAGLIEQFIAEHDPSERR